MITVFRSAASNGANELVDALNEAHLPARRIRQAANVGYREGRENRLICWGSVPTGHNIALVLNGAPLKTKLQDALTLIEAGVPTIEVSRTRPTNRPAERPTMYVHGGTLTEAELRRLITDAQAHLAAPLPPAVEWLGRSNNHIGGHDLMGRLAAPDYWVKKESLTEEYRLHMFRGRSIRAGKKIVGGPHAAQASEWIRSYDAGWIIAYENFRSTNEMRDLAMRAVAALGLDFGAVDLGLKADGSLIVLEVNRAPGIEGGTVEAYVEAIRAWIEGTEARTTTRRRN